MLDNDAVAVCVGASSRDIRLSEPLRIAASPGTHSRPISSTVPMVRQALDAFLQTPAGITAEEVEHRPKQCRNTFFGIFTTLDRRQRMTFDEGAVEVVCSEISEKMGPEEKAAARTRTALRGVIPQKRSNAPESLSCDRGGPGTRVRNRGEHVMTVHKRIRQFNTKDTYPEQKLDNDLCQTVVAKGSMVFVRGQIGQDLHTSESVAIGDATGQTEKAMANIDMLLKEAGSQLEHICKITIYIIDPRYREAVYRVVGKWLKGVYPVSTGIIVSALARPEWLVEVDAIAVIPDQVA